MHFRIKETYGKISSWKHKIAVGNRNDCVKGW